LLRQRQIELRAVQAFMSLRPLKLSSGVRSRQ
jgi:hypothetical protein